MSMLKMYKCICCLIKSSKYLYIAKKVVCAITIMLCAASLVIGFCGTDSGKKLFEKIKAVM